VSYHGLTDLATPQKRLDMPLQRFCETERMSFCAVRKGEEVSVSRATSGA
jgi:hypothetical protein